MAGKDNGKSLTVTHQVETVLRAYGPMSQERLNAHLPDVSRNAIGAAVWHLLAYNAIRERLGYLRISLRGDKRARTYMYRTPEVAPRKPRSYK